MLGFLPSTASLPGSPPETGYQAEFKALLAISRGEGGLQGKESDGQKAASGDNGYRTRFLGVLPGAMAVAASAGAGAGKPPGAGDGEPATCPQGGRRAVCSGSGRGR